MISFKNRALIVSLELLTRQLKNSFDCIYSVMLKSGVVIRTIEKKGFLIIYVYSDKISEFFKNSGFWLEYITTCACREIGFNASRGVLLKTKDKTIQEVDVLVDLSDRVLLIECKDTYSYSDIDLRKLFYLRKRISDISYGIFVCTKLAYNVNYDKYDLGIIKYKYNYEEFREDLKEIITNQILGFNKLYL
jgi:hypothetical protein